VKAVQQEPGRLWVKGFVETDEF